MRSFIIQNFKVKERSITEHDLLDADELFLTNHNKKELDGWKNF